MEFQELKDKAKELLEPFEQRYSSTISNIHWVTQDEHDIEGDFCEKCIGKAVEDARKAFEEEKQKVLDKFKEIEKTGKFNGKKIKGKYTVDDIKSAKKYELEKLGNSEFDSTHNYGGGYECSDFKTCDNCDKELDISILPSEQNLEYVLEDLESGSIDDQTGYRAYWLLYNSWDEECEKYKEETELTKKLANRVIEIINVAGLMDK